LSKSNREPASFRANVYTVVTRFAPEERVLRQRHDQRDCALLLEQIPVLEGWVEAAAGASTPFIVLGDFNRRFTQPNDRVWADLTALTQDMPISCRDNTFTEFIDHIVVDRRVRPWVDRTSFR
jgi:endonuclease/exonuclease/phosphatase family metal-dependent hydrolase